MRVCWAQRLPAHRLRWRMRVLRCTISSRRARRYVPFSCLQFSAKEGKTGETMDDDRWCCPSAGVNRRRVQGLLNGVCVLDPSRAEELNASYTSGMICAFMPSLQQITHFTQTGQIEDKAMTQVALFSSLPSLCLPPFFVSPSVQLSLLPSHSFTFSFSFSCFARLPLRLRLQMLELSVDGCTKLHSLMRDCLVQALKKKLAARQTSLPFSSLG
jgi:hypothetical protein